MTAAIVVTIVVVVLTVLVLALYLLKISLTLARALAGLRAVNKSLKAIPAKAEPAGPILEAVSADLSDASALFEDLLSRKRQSAPGPAGLKPPGPGTLY